MTNVRGDPARVNRKDVLSSDEIDNMLSKADHLETEYLKLRAKALVCIFKPFGKRRAEVSRLEITDLKIEGDYLYVTFTVVKKRKKKVLATRRTKRIQVTSKYAEHIIEYLGYMKEHHPDCKHLFPSTQNVFGQALAFSKDKHLSGRQILRIIHELNSKAWCHLFRETRGADIVRADEREKGQASLETVFRVKLGLDLEREATAWNYVRRYMTETIEVEEA